MKKLGVPLLCLFVHLSQNWLFAAHPWVEPLRLLEYRDDFRHRDPRPVAADSPPVSLGVVAELAPQFVLTARKFGDVGRLNAMAPSRHRLIPPHGVEVAQVSLDQELGVVLMEDQPMGDDHVLEQRATQHCRLDGLPVAGQLADRVEGLLSARGSPCHNLLHVGIHHQVATRQVAARLRARVQLALDGLLGADGHPPMMNDAAAGATTSPPTASTYRKLCRSSREAAANGMTRDRGASTGSIPVGAFPANRQVLTCPLGLRGLGINRLKPVKTGWGWHSLAPQTGLTDALSTVQGENGADYGQ